MHVHRLCREPDRCLRLRARPPKPAAKPARRSRRPSRANRRAEPHRNRQPPAERRAEAASKAIAAIREAYAAMPLSERLSIQSDLIWSGDYNGGVTGEFGDRAIAAVKAFQKKQQGQGNRPAHAAGARGAGRRGQAATRAGRLESGRRPGDARRIPRHSGQARNAIRARQQRQPLDVGARRSADRNLPRERQRTRRSRRCSSSRRKSRPAELEYNVLRPDFFVLSGMQGLKKFYVRVQLKDNEVRGMTVLYDQAMEGIMQPVVVAMSSAFTPFGEGPAMPRRQTQGRIRHRHCREQGRPCGHRAQATDDCQVIVVPGRGHAERVAEDQGRRARAAADLWRRQSRSRWRCRRSRRAAPN